MVEGLQLLLLSQPAPPVRTPGLDGDDSLHIRPRAMRSIAVFTAAVLAAVVSPANAEKLKLRCASPESPLGPSAFATLFVDEVNGQITQIWDSTGYEETSPATFKDGVWRWVGWRSEESGWASNVGLDRRTGEIVGVYPSGEIFGPIGPICR